MFIKLSGKCPHCDVVKHQIDTSEEHAVDVLNKAFADHIAAEHPDRLTTPVQPAQPGADQ